MIRYALVCERHHEFESWFQDSGTYDKQIKRGLVTCPQCGSTKVEKAIMAPHLSKAAKTQHAPIETPAPTGEIQPPPAPRGPEAR